MKRARTTGMLVLAAAAAIGMPAVIGVESWQRAAAARGTIERLSEATEALGDHLAPLFGGDPAAADRVIREWAAASGLRVTLIAADGRVVADSWTLPKLLDRLENHLHRPEVEAAARLRVGVDRRRSATTDRPTTYVARLVGSGNAPLGFLRLATEDEPRAWPWPGLLAVLLAAGAAALIAARRSRDLQRVVVGALRGWTDLPPDADPEAVAEEADRRFRGERESLVTEAEATRVALGEIDEGVILIDRGGIVRHANVAAAALLGGEIALARPFIETVRAPELVAAVDAVLAGPGVRHSSFSTPAGVELAVRACALPHPSLAAAVVVSDLTPQRDLERARRALVADLAHELRTPLTVLAGLAEELREDGLDSEVVATLERQVRRLATLAEELGELAQIEAGQVVMHRETIDAAVIVRQALHDAAATAAAAGIELASAGEPAPLIADPVRLAQVLGNLIENAIRYNRPSGRVTVTTSVHQGKTHIDVVDTGIGIPAHEIPLVFQRFYRVRGTSRPEPGSGLGLAIVKHLVHALGGTVSLTSEEGAGTMVSLTFPAAGQMPAA